jgi:DNA-binding NarL/FixJ family response regulator
VTEEEKNKIKNNEDYINCPKFRFSIKELINRYPEGVSNEAIAKALNISTQEVQEIYQSAIKKIQEELKL